MRKLISPPLLRAELEQSEDVSDVVFRLTSHLAKNADVNFHHVATEISALEARLVELRKGIPSYVPLFHIKRDERDLIVEVWVEYLTTPGGAAQ